MPTTPDRPDGRSAGSGRRPAETARRAAARPARSTANSTATRPVPIGRRRSETGSRPREAGSPSRPRPAVPDGRPRPGEPTPVGPATRPSRSTRPTAPTVRSSPATARPSSCPASAARRNAPAARRCSVAAGFATLWAALRVVSAGGRGRSAWPAPWRAPAGWAAPPQPGWPAGCSATAYRSAPRSARSALAPLLLTLLAGWRLNRAGLHVTRAIGARRSGSPRDALLVAGQVGLCVRGPRRARRARSSTGRGTGGLRRPGRARTSSSSALAGALVGSLRGTGALVVLARRIPPRAAPRPAHRAGRRAADPGRRRRVHRAVRGGRRRPGGGHDRRVPDRGRRSGRHHPGQPGLRRRTARSGRRPTCSARASRWAPTRRYGSPR